jgi:hypothetical protein
MTNKANLSQLLQTLKVSIVSAVAGLILLGGATTPAQAAPVKNIVLVHGAWVDGSDWKHVYEILTKDGYNVTIVQVPETSLQDDVAATKRVLMAARSIKVFRTISRSTPPFREPASPRSNSIHPSLKPSSIRMRGIGFLMP